MPQAGGSLPKFDRLDPQVVADRLKFSRPVAENRVNVVAGIGGGQLFQTAVEHRPAVRPFGCCLGGKRAVYLLTKPGEPTRKIVHSILTLLASEPCEGQLIGGVGKELDARAAVRKIHRNARMERYLLPVFAKVVGAFGKPGRMLTAVHQVINAVIGA